MSLQLSIVSFASRLFFKPAIAFITNKKILRAYLDLMTRLNGVNPKGAVYEKGILTYQSNSVPVVWAHGGNPSKDQVLLYIHGGGFVFGSAATYKHLAADIAGQLGIKAVLPNYRLAPENTYPKGFDDVVTSYQALLEMGYTSENIVVGEDSAGGNLAFALLAHIKAEKLPLPVCSFTFAALTELADVSESRVQNAHSDCVLVAKRFSDMNKNYAPNQDLKSPYLSPVRADFTGLTPVFMQASKGEILVDDSRAMLETLKGQGVDARLALFDNNFHVFQIMRGLLPEADQAITQVVNFVKQHLKSQSVT